MNAKRPLKALAASLAGVLAASSAGASEPLSIHAQELFAPQGVATHTKPKTVTKQARGNRAHQVTGYRFVNNCNESGPDSFRDAVGGAFTGDEIDFSNFLPCSTITLTSGEVVTSAQHLWIIGPNKGITIDAGAHSRIINHTGFGEMYLLNITFANGKYKSASASGGCVRSAGSVRARSIVMSGCQVNATGSGDAKGAGLYASQDVTLYNSTITGSIGANTGTGSTLGGGVYAGVDGFFLYTNIKGNTIADNYITARGGGIAVRHDTTLRYSTLSGNNADTGGAAYLSFGPSSDPYPAEIQNSTISGNQASTRVGGLFVKTHAQINASTIAFNHEQVQTTMGAGLYLGSDSYMSTTIVAKNTSTTTESDLGAFTFATISGNHNLIMHSQVLPPPGTITPDPLLLPLRDNGGVTPAHGLPSNSPAIAHGSSTILLIYDQRGKGFKRDIGTRDIGAFEYDGDIIFATGFN